MDARSYCRDERGLVVAWLVRVLLVIALVGVVLYDAGSMAVNYITLDGTANEVAAQVSADVASGAQVVPNLKCSRRSRVAACAVVYAVARQYGVRVIDASFDQEADFHIELRRTAKTLIVGRIGAIEDWATSTASAGASTN